MHHIQQIKTPPSSLLIYWFDEEYEKQIKLHVKSEVERNRVNEVIQSFYPQAVLLHQENGAPYLEQTPFSHLSISHSKGWYAVYLSNQPVGVDIQKKGSKITLGTAYFLNEHEEKKTFSEDDLYLLWSAKEAVYKKHKGGISDLKKEVTMDKIEELEHKIWMKYKGETEELSYYLMDRVTLVWTNH